MPNTATSWLSNMPVMIDRACIDLVVQMLANILSCEQSPYTCTSMILTGTGYVSLTITNYPRRPAWIYV